MTDFNLITLLYAISRYFHLLAAVVGVGGTFILRYVVLPNLEQQPPDVQRSMHAGNRGKLWGIMLGAFAILIISGTVNLIRAFTVAPAPPPTYHMILGIKLLAAIVLFIIGMMMVWPGDSPNAVQQKRRFYLSLNAHLGFLIIAFSVALRFLSGK